MATTTITGASYFEPPAGLTVERSYLSAANWNGPNSGYLLDLSDGFPGSQRTFVAITNTSNSEFRSTHIYRDYAVFVRDYGAAGTVDFAFYNLTGNSTQPDATYSLHSGSPTDFYFVQNGSTLYIVTTRRGSNDIAMYLV